MATNHKSGQGPTSPSAQDLLSKMITKLLEKKPNDPVGFTFTFLLGSIYDLVFGGNFGNMCS
jgi:hypothetical protein